MDKLPTKIAELRFDELEISRALRNVLKNAKLATVGEVVALGQVKFLDLPNSGKGKWNEITHLVQQLNTISIDGSQRAATAAEASAFEIDAGDENAVDAMTSEELGSAIERAIRALRPEYGACIMLRHVEGRSYEEIAATLDLPLGTVGTYIHRARSQLLLEKYKKREPNEGRGETDKLPAHIAEMSFDEIEMSRALRNVLKNARLATVGDAVALGQAKFRDLPGVGQKKWDEFVNLVQRLVETSGAQPTVPEEEQSQPDESNSDLNLTFTEHLKLQLATLKNARDAEIWKLYFIEKMTLDAIGTKNKVTRERARQLRDRANKHVFEHGSLRTKLHTHIENALRSKDGHVTIEQLMADDDWFEGCDTNGLASVVSTLNALSFYQHTKKLVPTWYVLQDEPPSLSRWDDTAWNRCRGLINDLLQTLRSQLATYSEVFDGLERDIQNENIAIPRSQWERYVMDVAQFADTPSGERRLVAIGQSRMSQVAIILHEAEFPISIADVIMKCAGDAVFSDPKQQTENYVRNALVRAGGYTFGRNVYGLPSHLPYTQDQRADLRVAIETILISAEAGQQMSSKDLLRRLSEQCPEIPDEINEYHITVLIAGTKHAAYVGRGYWQTATQGTQPKARKQVRIEFAKTCEGVLEKAGRPLTTAEIQREVEKERGSGSYKQILPTQRIKRMGRGLWGLKDRDFALTDNQIDLCLAALEQRLDNRNKGFHQSELTEFIKASNLKTLPLNAVLLFALAEDDSRFRTASGLLVGLAKWGDVRRLTPAGALQAIHKNHTGPWSKPQLKALVDQKVERHVNDLQVYSAAIKAGFAYDSIDRRWTIANLSEESNYELDDA